MAGDFGFGTALKLSTVAVARLTSISGPSYEADTIDVTAHDSSTSYYREYIPGLLDAGEVSFEGFFDPNGATHDNTSGGIIYEYEQRNAGSWAVHFPDTTYVSFTGYVTALDIDNPHDDASKLSGTIKISGKPTWTYA